MKNLMQVYKNRFSSKIDQIIGQERESLIVLRGAPSTLLYYYDESLFLDATTFTCAGSDEIFNKEWFFKIGSKLLGNDPLLISYSQMASILSYLKVDMISSRLVLINDSIRTAFPLSKKDSLLENEEDIRPSNLPSYQVEQLISENQAYYVPRNLEGVFSKEISIYDQETEVITCLKADRNEAVFEVTSTHSISFFIAECLKSDQPLGVYYFKLNKKHPQAQSINKELSLLNTLFAEAGSKLCLIEQEDVSNVAVSHQTKKLLKEFWGEEAEFKSFQVYKNPSLNQELSEVSQGEIVETIINEYECAKEGKSYRDLFLTAPTGAGKSLLFQLPAFHASKQGDVTIVVSPLIALMDDQVTDILNKREFKKVTYINSNVSMIDRDAAIEACKSGDIDVLYLAPELLLSYDISYFVGERRIGLIVIDEAHLVTTWGRDFRVDYWHLGLHLQRLRKSYGRHFPLVAVTATAVHGGANDMVFDSLKSLYMKNPHVYIGAVRRDDITFLIDNYQSPNKNFVANKLNQTVDFIKRLVENTSVKALVYAPFSTQVKEITQKLHEKKVDVAVPYYGGMSAIDKKQNSELFALNKKQVMVSTKAFGMGVDISDIQLIYHHAPSGILPDYIQEVGRAARKPGLQGFAALNYSKDDQYFSTVLQGMSALKQYELKEVLKKLSALYKLHKQRNMLISPEDFAHVFNDDNNLSQKLSTALMMIENDYLNRYRFNVLIARPKKLFAEVYARTLKQNAQILMQRYPNAITSLPYRINSSHSYLKIDLEKVWEKKFSNISFPRLKRDFYLGKLFDKNLDVVPQVKLSVNLSDVKSTVVSEFDVAFTKMKYALQDLEGKTFTKAELSGAFKRYFGSIKGEQLAQFFLNNYLDSSNRENISACYILKKMLFETDLFIVGNPGVLELKRQQVMNKLDHLFRDDSGSKLAFRYLNPKGSHIQDFHHLAYFLEILGCGTYETVGGENAKIFVRLNDPDRIERDSYGNYYNQLLKQTLDRHSISTQIFQHFFTITLSNKERWDFIENFFLGMELDELLEKYPNSTTSNRLDVVEELKKIEASQSKDNSVTNSSSEDVLNANVNNLKDKFTPKEGQFYSGDTNISLEIDGKLIVKTVSEWLSQDPLSLFKAQKKYKFNLKREYYKVLLNRIENNYPQEYTRHMGLNKLIDFPHCDERVEAIVPYNNMPNAFRKWYNEDTSRVYLKRYEIVQLEENCKKCKQ